MSGNSGDEDVRKYMYRAVKSNWHIYSLLVVLVFTLITRLQGYASLRSDGTWLVLGNDSWYHLRATEFSIENFPRMLSFDAKTAYPTGSTPGAFGTIYDLLHSTVSLIVGLGNPSAETVRFIAVVSSPLFSVLTVLMLYVLVSYLTKSRVAGIGSAASLALIPGTFYQRGYAGFFQHHIAEAFLLLVVVYLVIRCIDYAEQNLIIYEVLKTEGLTEEIKIWMKYMFACSASIFIYFLTWQPSAMFIGVIAISGLIYSMLSKLVNRTSQPTLLTLTVIISSTVPLILVQRPVMDFSLANTSLLHLSVTLVSSLTMVFITVLDRESNRREWSSSAYITTIFAFGVATIGVFYVVSPSGFSSAVDAGMRLLGYPLGIASSPEGVQTIGEEQSTTISDLIYDQYGLLILFSLASLFFLGSRGAKQILDNKSFSPQILISVLYIFVLAISLGTVRFNYYLAPVLSVLVGVGIYGILDASNLYDTNRLDSVSSYQVLSVLLILFMFVPVLVVPVSGGSTVYEDRNLVSGYQQWEGSLEWLSENSPDDTIDPFENYGNNYEYDENSYGVMSWWDYGHWITTTGNRTPVANPLQKNVGTSSDYLLAQSSEEAEEVMSDLGNENSVQDATSRYVMIDWQMVSPFSKFGAITAWNDDEDFADYFRPYYTVSSEGAQVSFFQKTQEFHESMLGRLYLHHGSAVESSTRTVQYDTSSGIRTIEPVSNPIINHSNLTQARQYQAEGLQVSRGGIAGKPPESIEALENYRLVKSSQGRSYQTRDIGLEYFNINASTSENIRPTEYNEVPSTVKTFERVEGAQIELSGYDSGEYTLEVDVTDTVAPRENSFTYKQYVQVQSNQTQVTTVPYSTTGYDNRNKNPDVRGTSSYRLVNESGEVVETFDVSEGDVVSESDVIDLNPNN